MASDAYRYLWRVDCNLPVLSACGFEPSKPSPISKNSVHGLMLRIGPSSDDPPYIGWFCYLPRPKASGTPQSCCAAFCQPAPGWRSASPLTRFPFWKDDGSTSSSDQEVPVPCPRTNMTRFGGMSCYQHVRARLRYHRILLSQSSASVFQSHLCSMCDPESFRLPRNWDPRRRRPFTPVEAGVQKSRAGDLTLASQVTTQKVGCRRVRLAPKDNIMSHAHCTAIAEL